MFKILSLIATEVAMNNTGKTTSVFYFDKENPLEHGPLNKNLPCSQLFCLQNKTLKKEAGEFGLFVVCLLMKAQNDSDKKSEPLWTCVFSESLTFVLLLQYLKANLSAVLGFHVKLTGLPGFFSD